MSDAGRYAGPPPGTDTPAPPQPLPTSTQNTAPPAQPAPGYGVPPPTYGEATGSMPQADPGAPLPYQKRVVTTTTTSQAPVGAQQPFTQSEDLTFHKEHLRSVPGIFQIVECVSILYICIIYRSIYRYRMSHICHINIGLWLEVAYSTPDRFYYRWALYTDCAIRIYRVIGDPRLKTL